MASSLRLLVQTTMLAAALPLAFVACGSKTGLLIDDTGTTGAVDGGLPLPTGDSGTTPANVPCKDGTFTLTPAEA